MTFCRNNYAHRHQIDIGMYEAKLQQRIMSENVAIAELKLKTEECEALKVKSKEAEAWKNWCCGLMQCIVVLIIIVAFAVGKKSG